jgi:hypothetical protein
MSQVESISADLATYLNTRGFQLVPGAESSTRGVKSEAYENGEFRVRVVRERSIESYVEVGPCGGQGSFLSGVVAFLANDDTLTRVSGQDSKWLSEHHTRIANLFGKSSEAEREVQAYRDWLSAFGQREQKRMEEAVAHSLAERAKRPWWKQW